jgi:hypothetical protein
MKKVYSFLLVFHLVSFLLAQSSLIQLGNPSFEDVPGPARPPLGWFFCGPPEETPPDVHPVTVMSVTQLAFHGKTYAGLVSRDNDTAEALGQSLDHTLEAGSCYMLRLYTSRSPIFKSHSRSTGDLVDFTQPIKLQIWAGNLHCQNEELLAETPLITDTTWQMHEMHFSPKANYKQLYFTAAREKESAPYNGHLLLDHLSPVIPLDCSTGVSLTLIEEKEESVPAINNYDDLQTSIQEQIKQLHWVRDGFGLEQNLIPSAKQISDWEIINKAIYQISEGLKVHPKALLTIAVGPPKGPLVQHHIRLLAAEFMAVGLPPERCLIRPMKKKDLRKGNWLTEGTEQVYLLWGISE